MSKLRDHLSRLRQPVEVDAIRAVVDDAERAVRIQVDALNSRISDAIADLRHHRDELTEMLGRVDALDAATGAGKGFLATLRASMAHEQVEEAREQAAVDLTGGVAVLARRIQRAIAMAEETEVLREDVHFAVDALRDLEHRARGADLTPEARLVARAGARLTALDPRLEALAGPLIAPVTDAREVLASARARTARFLSTERASTVGEAMLDGVLSREGGAVTQRLRQAVGEAAPGWVPDVDRDALEHQQALDELDDDLGEATESARREEELRRAAEAELDALEWDP